jgi:hypothetical protein
MDEHQFDRKKRFTPWIKLLEIVVLGFADLGDLTTFRHLSGMERSYKDACLSLMAAFLGENREEICRNLNQYCNIAPEDIRVYALGNTPPNVFSILHVTVESLIQDYVCPSICDLLISAKFDIGHGGEIPWPPEWFPFSV